MGHLLRRAGHSTLMRMAGLILGPIVAEVWVKMAKSSTSLGKREGVVTKRLRQCESTTRRSTTVRSKATREAGVGASGAVLEIPPMLREPLGWTVYHTVSWENTEMCGRQFLPSIRNCGDRKSYAGVQPHGFCTDGFELRPDPSEYSGTRAPFDCARGKVCSTSSIPPVKVPVANEQLQVLR